MSTITLDGRRVNRHPVVNLTVENHTGDIRTRRQMQMGIPPHLIVVKQEARIELTVFAREYRRLHPQLTLSGEPVRAEVLAEGRTYAGLVVAHSVKEEYIRFVDDRRGRRRLRPVVTVELLFVPTAV